MITGGFSKCKYNDAGTEGLSLTYFASGAKPGFNAERDAAAAVRGSMAGPTVVTGIGDAAFVDHFGR